MDETTNKMWETWAAAALRNHVSRIIDECVGIEDRINLFPNGKDKVKIINLVHEIENRATWINQLALRQMIKDMKKEA